MSLFINGDYKGYYNPTERVRSSFMRAHHGGGEEWDVLTVGGEAQEGDDAAWNALRCLVEMEDVTDSNVYQQVEQKLDLVGFVDYLLLNVYTAMGDWPNNNWRAGRDRGPGGIYRFYVWDAEWGFGGFSDPRVRFNSFTGASRSPGSSGLANTAAIARFYQRLRESAEFRLLFADRVNEHFFNAGALTDAHVLQRFDELSAELSGVFDMSQYIRETWVPRRRSILFRQMTAEGLLVGVAAPTFGQHGGAVPGGFALTVSAADGTVYYTTDGTDPRERFSGAVSASAERYVRGVPIVLNESVVVKMRALDGEWSALASAPFEVIWLGDPSGTAVVQPPRNERDD